VGHKISAPGPLLASGPWVAHPCFTVLKNRTTIPLSEGCCSRNPGYDSNIGSVGASLWFGVPTMLCRPESTKEGVEPKSLGITAIEVQLNCYHDFNVIRGIITIPHLPCRRIVQCETRPILSYESLLFSCLYENESTFGHRWIERGLKLLWFEQM